MIFSMNCDISHIKYDELPRGPARLRTSNNRDLNFDVFVREINIERKEDIVFTKIQGDIEIPITIPNKTEDCYMVKFHVINFISYLGEIIVDRSLRTGRLILKYNDLKVEIDRNNNADKLFKDLEKKGGYAITHTGLIRHETNTLKIEDIKSLLDALYYFFAFISGRWCGPILSLGLSSDEKVIWKTWDVITEEWYAIVDEPDRRNKRPISGPGDHIRLTPWSSGWTWTHSVETSELNQAFVGFMKIWDDRNLRDSLKTAISLYVEANQALGGTESAIVLLQSALELLAYLHADDHLKGKPCKNRFKDISADERIRWLLEDLDIPVDVPKDMKEINNYCTEKFRDANYKDGAKAITFLRNGIIHPSKNLIERLNKTEDVIKLQALSLGIWYIEMVLLRLFNYSGRYANRLWRFHDRSFRGGMGFLQQIPWGISPLDCECDNCPILNRGISSDKKTN
jgi:hypothetical protein